MQKVIKVTKNEFTKFISQKKLYILFILIFAITVMGLYAYNDMVQNVLQSTSKAETYSTEFKEMAVNFSGYYFTKLSLTDFIYKPYISLYLIFIVIIAIDVFSNDLKQGNLKFQLISNVNRTELYIGKVLFMFIISILIAMLNFILVFIGGQLVFGGTVNILDILKVFMIYELSIFPAVALSLIIAILSFLKLSTTILTEISIGITLVLGIIDTFTNSKYFSPIGGLQLFSNDLPSLSNHLLSCSLVSLIYIVVLTYIIQLIIKKVDFVN